MITVTNRGINGLCRKIHGKPQKLKQIGNQGGVTPNQLSHANQASTVTGNNVQGTDRFNQQDVERLKNLVNQLHSPNKNSTNLSSTVTGSCSMALSGTQTSMMHLKPYSCTWIIDSGASDHMTSMPSVFWNYSPCSGRQKIKVANGTFSSVTGKGTVKISNNIILLSIGKLTKGLNYSVNFFPLGFYFQDQLGKMIGLGKQRDEVYYLYTDWSGEGESQCLVSQRPNLPMAKQFRSPTLWSSE